MSRVDNALTADSQKTIHVVATTFDETRAALAAAVPLSRGSGAKLVVLVPRIVPYPADLDASADASAFFARRYRRAVDELGGEARIQVCVCRGIDDIVSTLVAVDSPIVIGGLAGHWFTSPEERFANRLSRAGRSVIFVACGPNTTQRRIVPTAALVLMALGCVTWPI